MRPMLFVVDPCFKRGKKAYMSDKDDFLVMNFHELVWWWATNHFVFHEQARQCLFYWKKMTIQIGAWFAQRGTSKGMEMEGTMSSPEHPQPIHKHRIWWERLSCWFSMSLWQTSYWGDEWIVQRPCKMQRTTTKGNWDVCVQGKYSHLECQHVHKCAHNIVVISHLESHYP